MHGSEVALLDVRKDKTAYFEAAFKQVSGIIASMDGARFPSTAAQRSVAEPSRYLLLMHWRTVQGHTFGFRKSAAHEDWKRLLDHVYDSFSSLERFEPVFCFPAV